MRKTPAYIIIVLAGALALAGCDKQRDLYTVARPMLYVEGNWVPSLNLTDMTMNATASLYVAGGGEQAFKSYFSMPNSTTIPATRGEYDLLLFNGLMYSEQSTHLDNTHFRGTDRLATFEAVADESNGNGNGSRLIDVTGEYVASNDMELLTSMLRTVEVEGEAGYRIKYQNGKNGYPTYSDYIESSVYLTPAPVSYECQVVVNLVNPVSAYVSYGALRGFAGSVFMASRLPSHMEAVHVVRLNSLELDATPNPDLDYLNPKGEPTGSIRSMKFVTFGPPLDDPADWEYEFEIGIMLVNEEEFHQSIDISTQVADAIVEMRKNLNVAEPVVTGYTILIEVDVALDKLEPVEGEIGIGDWEDDEIIKVPIKWN